MQKKKFSEKSRTEEEARTAELMIRMFCRARHGSRGELCPACRELLAYARRRIQACPFGEEKPVCEKCPVHCYAPEKRDRIRAVMRYSGPRMVLHHPLAALRHLLRKRRPVPPHPGRKRPKA